MCCKDEYFFLINQAIDGELEGKALQQLEAHLAQCPQCRQMDAALRRMAAESAGLEQAAPAELTEKIMAQVRKTRRITPRPARIMRWVVSLSGAAAVLIMGFFALRLGFTRAGSEAADNCAPMAAPPEAAESGEAVGAWEDAVTTDSAAPEEAPAEGADNGQLWSVSGGMNREDTAILADYSLDAAAWCNVLVLDETPAALEDAAYTLAEDGSRRYAVENDEALALLDESRRYLCLDNGASQSLVIVEVEKEN